MFRFIHTADIHLDSPLEGLDAYDGAPVETLRGATRRALENLVRLAVEQSVDFVVIAGDVFDGDWKDFSTGHFFNRQMKVLAEADIPVYRISGNHDAASVLTRRLPTPPNVFTFSTRTAETTFVPSLPVAIHGRGFPERAVPENLVPDYPKPVADHFNIGLLHTSLNGTRGHDTYAPCSVADLTGKGYDYWALGHVHQPEVVLEDPWIVYCGNLQGRHARETGPRGCRLVGVDSTFRVSASEFIPLDVVRWQYVTVDLARTDHPDQAWQRIEQALQDTAQQDSGRLSAVRLVLTGTTSLHDYFRSHTELLRAHCINQAQLVAGDRLWLEDIRVRTSPSYALEDLAERDDLTRILLENLQQHRTGPLSLPATVTDMLKVLPAELRSEIDADLHPDQREELLNDVRAILLDAMVGPGETA